MISLEQNIEMFLKSKTPIYLQHKHKTEKKDAENYCVCERTNHKINKMIFSERDNMNQMILLETKYNEKK